MKHGNYRHVTHQQAYEESVEGNFTLVGLDGVYQQKGTMLHVVADERFYSQDEPQAYVVELARPNWLYGNEGLLRPIRFVGRTSDCWLDASEQEWFPGEDNDPFPLFNDSWLWALPNQLTPYYDERWVEVEDFHSWLNP